MLVSPRIKNKDLPIFVWAHHVNSVELPFQRMHLFVLHVVTMSNEISEMTHHFRLGRSELIS